MAGPYPVRLKVSEETGEQESLAYQALRVPWRKHGSTCVNGFHTGQKRPLDILKKLQMIKSQPVDSENKIWILSKASMCS